MPQIDLPAYASDDVQMIGGFDELEEFLRGVPAEELHARYLARFPRPAQVTWDETQLIAFVLKSFSRGSSSMPTPAGYSAATLASKEEFLEEFERQAWSWADEEDVRYGLAEARLALGGNIPLEERLECIETLKRGKPKRGPGAHSLTHRERDIHIMVTVDLVSRLGRLRATRNETSEHECACSIVARGLNECGLLISEKSVARIYRSKKRSLIADHPSTDALVQAQKWADEIYGTDADLELGRQLEVAQAIALSIIETTPDHEDTALFVTSRYRFVLSKSSD